MQTSNWDLNLVQLEILRELLFQKETTFSQIDKKGIGSNLIAYHLKKLLEETYVCKNVNGSYSLTAKGKEFGSMIDTWSKSAVIHKQGKLRSVAIIYRGEIGNSEFVLSTRLKEPFFEYSGFPTDKVQYGETPTDAIKRCVERETNLICMPVMKGISHKIMSKEGALLEDHYFFVFTGENAKGQLKQKGEGFSNKWVTQEEFYSTERIYKGTVETFKLAISSKELFYYEDRFDLEEF